MTRRAKLFAVLLISACGGANAISMSASPNRYVCTEGDASEQDGCRPDPTPLGVSEYFSSYMVGAFFKGGEGTLQRILGKEVVLSIKDGNDRELYMDVFEAGRTTQGYLPIASVPLIESRSLGSMQAQSLTLSINIYESSQSRIDSLKGVLGSLGVLDRLPGTEDQRHGIYSGISQITGISSEVPVISLRFSQVPLPDQRETEETCTAQSVDRLCEGYLLLTRADGVTPPQTAVLLENKLQVPVADCTSATCACGEGRSSCGCDDDGNGFCPWQGASHIVLRTERGYQLDEAPRRAYIRLLQNVQGGSNEQEILEEQAALQQHLPPQFMTDLYNLVRASLWANRRSVEARNQTTSDIPVVLYQMDEVRGWLDFEPSAWIEGASNRQIRNAFEQVQNKICARWDRDKRWVLSDRQPGEEADTNLRNRLSVPRFCVQDED